MKDDQINIEDICDTFTLLMCKEANKELIIENEITEDSIITYAVVKVDGNEMYRNSNPKLALDEYNRL